MATLTLLAVFGSVLTAAATTTITASPALAATSGCGSPCDGQNPETYRYYGPGGPSQWVTCSADAITKYTAGSSGHLGYAQLRYSPTCRTAWAKTNTVNGWIYVYSYNASGSLRRTESQYTNETVKYTRMVNDVGLTAKACATVPVSGGEMNCTAKY
jgi:hypothetical protein